MPTVIYEWDEVRFIEHAAGRPILFGGFVQSVRYTSFAAGGRMIEVECVGYGVLLDKKITGAVVVDYLADSPDYHSVHIPDLLVSAVNRFGGRISAMATVGTEVTGDTRSVVHDASWWWWYSDVVEPFTIEGGTTLRSMVEQIAGLGHSAWDSTPYPMVYWVDSAAMFRAHPDTLGLQPYGDWNPYYYGFDAGIYGPVFDTTGSYRVTGLVHERADIDRVTSVWVQSTSEAGTGWYRSTPLERAGDLQTTVTENGSISESAIANIGGPIAAASASATVNGTVTIQSATFQNFWPGREVRLNFPEVGLYVDHGTYDESWRMIGVSITFESETIRNYEIEWGGSAPARTISSRQGRYATRPIGGRPKHDVSGGSGTGA